MKKLLLNLFVFLLPAVTFAEEGSLPVLSNPLRFSSIQELITGLLSLMVTFAVPVLALAFAYSGFLFIRGASGKSGDFEKAKTAFFYSAIGGAVVLGAEIIVRVLENTVSALQ